MCMSIASCKVFAISAIGSRASAIGVKNERSPDLDVADSAHFDREFIENRYKDFA